jgi:TIR domain
MLKRAGVRTWFDEDQLPPGRPWQTELERQIASVKSAAVIVGPSGRGPWHDVEIRAFLVEFLNRSWPIIPVLLENCMTPPELPLFLKEFTWVDFRELTPDPFQQLLWGIQGTRGAL